MHAATLDVLRCPFCGGRLVLVDSFFHRREADEISEAILACYCCLFPIVAGIPIMHLSPPAVAAREHVQAGRPDLAMRAMMALEDEERAARFEHAAASENATYRDLVEIMGPQFEGGYFLYRFSDPTYVVSEAVMGAVAGTVLQAGGRAIDLCGGSGHLTRTLLDLSASAPVLADLYFSKIWLARRFTAPGCEGVCCDGNSPLPFARGAFRYAMCSDAFMFLWTKRQFVLEMLRLIDDGTDQGAAVIGHTHNERQWSPSYGQPLPPEGYRDLFETVEPRLFGETGLLADVLGGGPLDLSRTDPAPVLDSDPALTIVASRHPGVFVPHPLRAPAPPRGQLRVNPLYALEAADSHITLTLRFPSPDYEEEYGACRQYLPEQVVVDRGALAEVDAGRLTPGVAELLRRRIVLDLPKRYY
jgi:uncharacterized protein YbaR (Trm112 family)